MRLSWLVPAALLALTAPAFAQVPTEFTSKQDYFSISFQGTPKVENIVWDDEYRIQLPARTYSTDAAGKKYKVTVVDYRDAPKLHAARNAKCVEEAGANKPGLTPQQRRDLTGDACQDETVKDIRGAMMWATWRIVEKAAKVTHLAHYNSDVIEGHEVHTINPDESRTYAVIHMYENRLYIAESTVPKGAPAANWFQISIRFLDEQYNPVRYQYAGLMMYANGYPKPPRANQGGGGGQGGGRGGQANAQ